MEEKKIGIGKIFKASFEQSLNLADEDLLDVHKTWEYKQTLRKEKKRKPPGKIKTIINLVLLLFLVWLIFVAGNYMYSYPEEVVIMKINLLPQWLCWTLMAAFLIIVYGYKYGMKRNWEQMRFYNSQWMQFWYGLLILVVFNLFIFMFFMRLLPTYLVIIIAAGVVVFGILIFRSYMKGIVKRLYAPEEKEVAINATMKRILQTFLMVMSAMTVPYTAFKIRNRDLAESMAEGIGRNTPLLTALTIGGDLLMILLLVYAIFQFVIPGYYRNKYAEEYRKREGQTQIQWYGEKYFNKYIKGTEKEERNDDRDKEIITNG